MDKNSKKQNYKTIKDTLKKNRQHIFAHIKNQMLHKDIRF